ncbi:MAG: metallophosphoesterase [Verrucomicrobia bacterium]|nr:metallophosphoesterase [Verrucomicrobiota bacterium]
MAGRLEGAPEPVGAWGFDNPADLLQASAGGDLVLEGAHTAVPGLGAGDGAIRIGIGSYYRCEHGVTPNGSGNYVNQYSLLFDFRIPQFGPWYCFFQTSPANQNDGDCFVRANDGAIGVGQTGYSAMRAQPGVWQRLLIAVDNAAGIYDIYLDGELILDGAPQSIDGRFALDPTVLFFADENGEDAPIDVTRIAIYDRALTAADAAELGLPQVDDPANRPPEMIPGASGPGLVATGAPASYAFTARDPDEELVQVRVDWGDGEVSVWSSLAPSGTAVVQSHTFRLPGKYPLRAIARDQRGKLGVWTEIQTVEVEGDPAVEFLTWPYLQNVKPDGITIMWECDVAVDGEVRYGSGPTLDGLQPATTIASGAGTHIYRAVLRGLLPGTAYHFEVRVGGIALPTGTFTTAPLGHAEFAFAVWADSQGSNHGAYGPDPLEPTTSMMRHMGLSGIQFAVGAGDHAENGGSYSDTRQYYLDRVARWLGSAVPWYVAWGNHDGGRGTVIRKFADLPSQERPGFDAGYGSFSFDYAGCHFICIDYASAVDDIRTWLEADLQSEANRNARFTFLFVHVPPYCELWIDGNATYRNELVPLLEAYGVDLCFSGHTHEYSRGYLNGVHYCITGGGSWLDLPEVLVHDWDHMTVGGYHPIPGVPQYGPTRGGGLINEYVRVDVRADSFTASMIGFDPDGTEVGVLDTFESTAAQAPLRIAAIRRSGQSVELEWTGPDGPFRVQFRPDFGQGTWTDVGEPVAAAARATTLPAATAAGLYRIRLAR